MDTKNCIICGGKKFPSDLSWGFDRCTTCLARMIREDKKDV